MIVLKLIVPRIPALKITLMAMAIAFPPTGKGASPRSADTFGFSGRAQAGGGYFTSTDQLSTNADNRLAGLGTNADRFDRAIPLALVDLRYTFASRRQLYFGTPLESGGRPALALGTVLPLHDNSKLDLSVFSKPFEKVWQNPYVLGSKREDTDKTSYGARLAYSDILGTPTKITYSFANADVDDDVIGERFASLKRDGWLHEAQIEYAIPVGRGMSLVPGFEVSLGDADGDAESYTGYALKLGLRKFSSGYMFNVVAGVGIDDYDQTHPVFNKTREDISYSAFAVFTRFGLLGNQQMFSSLITGYRYRDSNIAFLDADTFLAGLTIGYNF